jgi:hypothetical protein
MPKLTDRFLAALKVEAGRKDRLVFDTETPGLGVRITKASKTFLAQWTDSATKRKIREPLGVWGNITIEQARIAARARLGDVAKGIDPRAERAKKKAIADRERAEAALTFDKLITDWETLHLNNRSGRCAAEAPRAIRYSFADMLKRPAARITKSDVVHVLDGLLRAKKAAAAARTRAYGAACFAWALRRGKVPVNPFHAIPVASAT